MGGSWLLIAAAMLQPVLLVVLVPRRWLGRAMLGWLALPVLACVIAIGWELATRPAPPDPVHNVLLGFSLLSATVGLAWVLASGVAFALGLGLRRLLRPGERRAPPPPAPTVPASRPAASPAGRLPTATGVPSGAPIRRFVSPDGRIAVGIDEVEWFNTHWVRSPRVEDRGTGQVPLDLWGSDWDAAIRFPAPGQVWLRLRRYRGPGAWTLLLDLAQGTGTISRADSHVAMPETVPIADVTARLEALSEAAMAAAGTLLPARRHPLAAWRTALVILFGAAVAIAGLVALLPREPPPPLDKLPDFTPPALPRIPAPGK